MVRIEVQATRAATSRQLAAKRTTQTYSRSGCLQRAWPQEIAPRFQRTAADEQALLLAQFRDSSNCLICNTSLRRYRLLLGCWLEGTTICFQPTLEYSKHQKLH